MVKEFLLVGFGSFLGGGTRYLVSAALQPWSFFQLPVGTFAVNIIGCFVLGLISGVSMQSSWLSPAARLILTTGFCGGFTTFSTFMKENSALLQDGHHLSLSIYIVSSLLVGLLAYIAGLQMARVVTVK